MPFTTCEYSGGACTYNAQADYNPPTHCQNSTSWISQPGVVAVNASFAAVPDGITEFDAYTDQELRATATEIEALPLLALGAIAATDAFYNVTPPAPGLPMSWAARSAAQRLTYTAQLAPNEHHTFQVGLAARIRPFNVSSYKVSGLPAAWYVTCFNLEGSDAWGQPWQPVRWPRVWLNWTLPLWFGLIPPANASASTSTFGLSITITDDDGQSGEIPITATITIAGTPLPDGGDGDIWRGTRLHWLNAQTSATGQPVKPFAPLTINPEKSLVSGKFASVQVSPVSASPASLSPFLIIYRASRAFAGSFSLFISFSFFPAPLSDLTFLNTRHSSLPS